MTSMARQRGFSLVELAIVVFVLGLLLGGLMMPLSVQRENARIRDGHEQLEVARLAIEGFALVNGYLPCPATPGSGGYADASGGGCVVQHGFVPATTLDLNGNRNADNLLLDPWGSPLRYSVSASDVNGDGRWDFVTAGEMRAVTLSLLQPEMTVCSAAAGATATNCATANLTLAERTPAVLYSMGKDWASFTSPDQQANAGATITGGASGARYAIASDDVFVRAPRSAIAGGEFDDLVIWLPRNTLYARLVAAGHLP